MNSFADIALKSVPVVGVVGGVTASALGAVAWPTSMKTFLAPGAKPMLRSTLESVIRLLAAAGCSGSMIPVAPPMPAKAREKDNKKRLLTVFGCNRHVLDGLGLSDEDTQALYYHVHLRIAAP